MIKSKFHYYNLYQQCYFGNRPKTWRPSELLKEKAFPEFVMARCLTPNGPTFSYCDKQKISKLLSDGTVCDSKYTINEQMPDDKIIIQGEYLPPFALVYSREKKPMKDAFKSKTQMIDSPYARLLMKEYMCEEAKEKLEWLIDTHGQDHTIEFSVYSCSVGVLGWNTIIWEVRNY
jgi:hypothetical protein